MKDYFGDIEEEVVIQPGKFKGVKDLDHIGKRYGNWVVVSVVEGDNFLVVCDCGKQYKRSIYTIYRLKSRSCSPCFRKMSSIDKFKRKI